MLYLGSLLGYHWLAGTTQKLGPPDLGTTADTVVVIDLQSVQTTDNQLTVKVLVLPEDSLMNTDLGVVDTDIAVRLYPANDLGDLEYPAGKAPSQLSATIEATGDPDSWPFDSYTTPTIQADVIAGSGDTRRFLPARVEVTGTVEGWDVRSTRSGESSQPSSDRGDDASITLHRAKGPLIFDLGICLVLVSLPTLAVFVVWQIARGRKKLSLSFLTWYSGMLFAVVPIRNILPGSPPYGAWIDQALVLWVLVALAASMAVFITVWFRQHD